MDRYTELRCFTKGIHLLPPDLERIAFRQAQAVLLAIADPRCVDPTGLAACFMENLPELAKRGWEEWHESEAACDEFDRAREGYDFFTEHFS